MADNSSRKFKFISPGVFINEIDQSQLPDTPGAVGPLVIGRSRKGPADKPVTVDSFSDFVQTFGNPVPGAQGGDVWREGNLTAPTYAAYAAQAWLQNGSPLTFIRVLGDNSTNASAGGKAGWEVGDFATSGTEAEKNAAGGVYALCVWPYNGSDASPGVLTGSVAAQIYMNHGRVLLKGNTGKPASTLLTYVPDVSPIADLATKPLALTLGTQTYSATFDAAVNVADSTSTKIGLADAVPGTVSTAIANSLNAAAAAGFPLVAAVDATNNLVVNVFGTTIGTDDNTKTFTSTAIPAKLTAPAFAGGVAASTAQDGSTIYEINSLDDITLVFTGSEGGQFSEEVTVSLNRDQENFIRKALNTNPTITNSAITDASSKAFYQRGVYFLGETFENSLVDKTASNSIGVLDGGTASATKFYAAMLPMAVQQAADLNATKQQSNFRGAATRASTGWFISQDLSSNNSGYQAKAQQKLFRLEALSAGESTQREIKISIANIKAPEGDYQDYGSFSVIIRDLQDTDNRPSIIERYDGVTLNPAADSYIAKRIGDKYMVYDENDKRLVEYGEFENKSNFVRVVVNDTVAAGSGERRWLPFGVFGPLQYRSVGIVSGSSGFSTDLDTPLSASRGDMLTMLLGGSDANYGNIGHLTNTIDIVDVPTFGGYGTNAFSGSIVFPSVPLRGQSSWGKPRSLNNTYWGAWTGRSGDDTFFSQQIVDSLRVRSADVTSFGEAANPSSTDYDIEGDTPTRQTSSALAISWVFSLDDVQQPASGVFTYASGSRNAGTAISAQVGNSYKDVLSGSIDRFTTTLHGGFDGYDITEREPFANRKIGSTEESSYELFSLRKAINIASDKDFVQMNAVAIPGVWKSVVTDTLLDVIEERGDALALVDIQYGYTPSTEDTGSAQTRNAANTPAQAADALADRSINNSYGATYYPWVRILDTNSNQNLWVPPTVPALGVLSSTDRINAPWFAPAGFTRGGLSEGAAGLPVLDVSRRLTSDDRDRLYENNINPIAKFPAEGIVIFGQKTLQQTESALDRINVRRLMIFLKREISFIASRLLFGPNAKDTWDRFLGQAGPILESVRAEFGIDDFRLILDETTTTPDLVDRNIIYAKLLVKPTRSVEYFAIDFVVTNSGAAFED